MFFRGEPRKTGAAMTEAIVIMPVLVIALFLALQAYKLSMLSTNTVVVGRSEMMMSAYLQNFSNGGGIDHSEHENRLLAMGIFKDATSAHIGLNEDKDNTREGPFGKFQAFAKIAAGADEIAVSAEIPVMAFVADESGERIFSCGYRGVCAVESWNWTEDLFGKLAEWITNMDGSPGPTLENDIDKSK